MDSVVLIPIIVVVVIIALVIFLHFVPMGLWISSLASGVHISIGTLVGMRIRRIQPQRLVYCLANNRRDTLIYSALPYDFTGSYLAAFLIDLCIDLFNFALIIFLAVSARRHRRDGQEPD